MQNSAALSDQPRALSPSDILAAEKLVSRAETLCNQGKYAEALAFLESLPPELQNLDSAWLLRATACVALRYFAEAAEAYGFILDKYPEFTAIRLNLAAVCIELDRMQDAEAHLLQAIAQKPDLAAAHANLGSLYMRADRYDLAEAPIRRALELDSKLICAHQNLAAILALRNSPDAKKHRDAAYSQQQIFLEPAPGANRTALILTSSGSGNVPYQHLLPRHEHSRIIWHIDYAPPGQELSLPPHDFVFNAVADPDAAPDALVAAQKFAATYPRSIFNRPERVARTDRSAMADLLGSVTDVVVPPVRRIERADGDVAKTILASGLAFPLILRPAGQHGGDGVKLVQSAAGLAGQIPDGEVIYATQFVDYRSADSWYRKYRVIFVDREPYPCHLAIGQRWLLHYKSASMTDDAALRAEEKSFLSDPQTVLGPRIMTALRQIATAIDLDYAGIDFSLLPDGRLLFFEANATMLVHPESDPLLAYKNKAVRAIIDAVQAMITQQGK